MGKSRCVEKYARSLQNKTPKKIAYDIEAEFNWPNEETSKD